MKKSYFPDRGVWLKGMLHSHSTVSDGAITPQELATKYHENGYDFLSMTDHNVFVPHSELPEEQIILLTGVEHDIEYSQDKCTHVVGIGAVDQTETKYCCKRYSKEELTDQELVDLMHGDGQFVTLAHPFWSRMGPEEVLELTGCHAMEVFNNGTEHLCHAGNAEIYWELMLRHGKRILATASDDVHTEEDLFGGWICVKAAERSRKAIMDALFKGAFYASSGPKINDFGIADGNAYVSCSNCREIHFVTYPPRGSSNFAQNGASLVEANHKLTGRESYVRVVCVDFLGRSAWTQPIYFD